MWGEEGCSSTSLLSQCLDFQPAQARVAYSISRTVLPHQDQDTQHRRRGQGWTVTPWACAATAMSGFLQGHPLLSGQPGSRVDPGNLDPAWQPRGRVHNVLATTHMRAETDLTPACVVTLSPLTWPDPPPISLTQSGWHLNTHNGKVEIEILISCAIFPDWPSAGHRGSACTNFHSDHSSPELRVIQHNLGCFYFMLMVKEKMMRQIFVFSPVSYRGKLWFNIFNFGNCFITIQTFNLIWGKFRMNLNFTIILQISLGLLWV